MILKDVAPDDFWLAIRAVNWLLRAGEDQKDGILTYGENPRKPFYVRRNKASITVRPL